MIPRYLWSDFCHLVCDDAEARMEWFKIKLADRSPPPKKSLTEVFVPGSKRRGAMDLWVIMGVFLLGVGVGAATTGALQVRKIRQLKRLLEYAHNNPRCDGSEIG